MTTPMDPNAFDPDVAPGVTSGVGLSGRGSASAGTGTAGTDNAMTLSRQQLTATSQWTRTGAVRLRRHIVVERRTVEVEVRREELVIESADVRFDSASGVGVGIAAGGPPETAPPAAPQPLVIVLREEIPQVMTTVRPYERVVATVTRVTGETVISGDVAHEEVTLEQSNAPGYGTA